MSWFWKIFQGASDARAAVESDDSTSQKPHQESRPTVPLTALPVRTYRVKLLRRLLTYRALFELTDDDLANGLDAALREEFVVEDEVLNDFFSANGDRIIYRARKLAWSAQARRISNLQKHRAGRDMVCIESRPGLFETWKVDGINALQELIKREWDPNAQIEARRLLECNDFDALIAKVNSNFERTVEYERLWGAVFSATNSVLLSVRRSSRSVMKDFEDKFVERATRIVRAGLEADDAHRRKELTGQVAQISRGILAHRIAAHRTREIERWQRYFADHRDVFRPRADQMPALIRLGITIEGVLAPEEIRRLARGLSIDSDWLNQVRESGSLKAFASFRKEIINYPLYDLEDTSDPALFRQLAEAQFVRLAYKENTRQRQIKEAAEALRRRQLERERHRRNLAEAAEKAEKARAEALKSRPDFRAFKTPRDFEEHACRWMAWLGFYDATLTPIGPDGGIDIVSRLGVAQVKWQSPQIGIDKINEFVGASGRYPGRQMLYFSASGYTKSATERASIVNSTVALFCLDQLNLEPQNEAAQTLYRKAERGDVVCELDGRTVESNS